MASLLKDNRRGPGRKPGTSLLDHDGKAGQNSLLSDAPAVINPVRDVPLHRQMPDILADVQKQVYGDPEQNKPDAVTGLPGPEQPVHNWQRTEDGAESDPQATPENTLFQRPAETQMAQGARGGKHNWEPGYFKGNGDWAKNIAFIESSDRYDAEVNDATGFALGMFQMRKPSLEDTGYMDASGNWTGRNGIHSKEDFLQSPDAQHDAARSYIPSLYRYLGSKGALNHLGQEMSDGNGSISVSSAGLMAGAWLLGAGGMNQFLNRMKSVNWDLEKLKQAKTEKGVSLWSNKYLDVMRRLRRFRDVGFSN